MKIKKNVIFAIIIVLSLLFFGASQWAIKWEEAADLDSNGALNTDCVSDNEIDYTNVTLADFDYQTAWRIFYSNADGDITELALGTDGQYLKSEGATSAPVWDTPGGSGDIESAGDCLTGACYDGSSDGGTYARIYDGDSHYLELNPGDLSANRTLTTRDAAGTLLISGDTLTGDVTATFDSDGSTAVTVAWGNIAEGELADNTVVSADIKDDTIDSADYNADSIDNEHINWSDIDNLGDEGAITLADESTDTSCYVAYATAATGDLPLKTGTNLTFNSNTGALTATSFSGDGSSLTALNGEQISNDTIDDDSLDFGTGADQISASDMPDEDIGDISILSGSYTLDTGCVLANEIGAIPLQKDFTLHDPADADDALLFKAQKAMTITDIHCIIDPADNGESITLDIYECDSTGDNCATTDAAITCDNDGAEDDGSFSNGSIDAGDWIQMVIGAPSGTVSALTFSIYYTEDI